jgi:hypothetical protein
VKNDELTREKEQAWQTATAYKSVRARLEVVSHDEFVLDKQAFKRTGTTTPAKLYGRPLEDIDPAFSHAMQRLWDIGTTDATGRADTELRRPYHLIAKGKAPVTEADVIKLGQMPEPQLRLLLPRLAHRLSLVEAQDHVDLGEVAPPVISEEVASG